ncbi:hypothetical protein SDC9_198501 [bioreactor metagenome]|uniref:Uncharacterized protein n=1 Tax=bioreactor metagenome TaxID=1076179 RepID=A0A645IHU2_9ZZZZ
MTFTGYTMEQLKEMKLSGIESLLEHTDILVDGAFLLDSPERERNWVGSTNQVIHFLSNRYPAGIEDDSRYTHAMEVRIGDNGEILANGYPIFDFKNHEELLSKS